MEIRQQPTVPLKICTLTTCLCVWSQWSWFGLKMATVPFVSVIFCSCTTTLKCTVTTTHCSKLTLLHFAHDKKDAAALLRSGIHDVISAVWCNPQLSEPRWLWRTLTAVVEMSGLRFCLFWRSRIGKTQITTWLTFPPHLCHTWFSKSALNWGLDVYITVQVFLFSFLFHV